MVTYTCFSVKFVLCKIFTMTHQIGMNLGLLCLHIWECTVSVVFSTWFLFNEIVSFLHFYFFICLFNQHSKAWLISFELELGRNLFCRYNLIIISWYNLITTVLKMDLSLKSFMASGLWPLSFDWDKGSSEWLNSLVQWDKAWTTPLSLAWLDIVKKLADLKQDGLHLSLSASLVQTAVQSTTLTFSTSLYSCLVLIAIIVSSQQMTLVLLLLALLPGRHKNPHSNILIEAKET